MVSLGEVLKWFCGGAHDIQLTGFSRIFKNRNSLFRAVLHSVRLKKK